MTKSPAPMIDLSFLRARAAQKRIGAITLAFLVAGALWGLLGPKWYRSSVTLVPVKAQRAGGLSALLGGDLASLASGFEGAIGGGADSNRIASVLQGTTVTDAVIDRFDLQERYSERYRESAREELWKHCSARMLPKPNIVVLSCEDKDPRFTQEMLKYFAEYGNQVFRRVNVSSASEEAKHLEKRVLELRQQADDAALRVREFQERHRIVDLDSQAKALVASIADLTSRRIAKQIELDYSKGFTSQDAPGIQQLRSQLSAVDQGLLDLEEAPDQGQSGVTARREGERKGRGIFPAAAAVPKLRAEFEKLYRDRKVAEATLLFALDRLEGARAAEARDTSTFVLLDPPPLPTRKSRPKTLESILIGGLAGLVAGVAFAYWRSSKDPVPAVGES